MKFLIVDNTIDRDSWGCADLRKLAGGDPATTVHVRRAPQGDLPTGSQGYDKIILSGSKTSALESPPWLEALQTLIRDALDRGKPLLGVCYGHQILARMLGGQEYVRKAKQPEIGWTQIKTVGESELFKGIPETFNTFSSHFEEVALAPPGTRQLARSDRCEIQAFQVDSKPAFGIQFHPEKDLMAAKNTFGDKHWTCKSPTLRPKDGERLYDPSIGAILFRNFLSI